jgi:ABC-type Fe3+-hydroxamate transport system substrate-binding protein
VRLATLGVFAAFLSGAAACSAPAAPPPPRGAAHRIVSLIPSLTEDLCAIGAQKDLIAVSVFSEDIPCARSLPAVDNYASIDVEKIVALHPDLVVAIPSQRALATPLVRAGVRVVFLRDDRYRDIFADIVRLGALAGRSKAAAAEVARLARETARLRRSVPKWKRPRVFVVVQAQPIWTVGAQSYIASLITLAGGSNASAGLHQPYAQYSSEALLRAQPDVVIAGRDAGLAPLTDREPWRSLRAVQMRRLYYYDPSLLDRPSPRYNQALRWLIARLSSR